MRPAEFNLLCILVWSCLIGCVSPVLASEKISATELEGIKTRLDAVEQANSDILAQKDKILGEIGRLRIWVRHSGGK